MNQVNWGEIYTAVLMVVLPPLIAWVVSLIAGGLRALWKVLLAKLKASLSAEQLAVAESLASQAVLMAEQIWHRPDVQAEFVGKKELAFDYVDRNLQKHGIKMSAQDIGALIEAAVYAELTREKEAAPAVVVPIPVPTEVPAVDNAA
jgi:hypothetical protein